MNNKIAFIDLDGTLIKGQSQALFINFLKKKKLISKIKSYVILLWFFLYKLQITKNTSLILNYALSYFKNKPVEKIYDTVDEFLISIISTHYYKYSKLFIENLKSQKIRIVILSTAVDFLVGKIASDLDIKDFLSTNVEIKNGFFTGNIIGGHVYGLEKLNKINEFIKKENLQMANTIVVADNYSDKEIILKAGIGIVANPDLKMKLWATQKKIRMVYLDDYESVQYIKSDTMY